jgi:biotin synthase
MRRDNTRENATYLLKTDDLVEAARQIKNAGINVVFFQGGEVPQTTGTVGKAIPRIRELFDDDVEILLNLGNKSRSEYAYLKEQGATSYILKHETSDRELNERVRHESFDQRLRCLNDLMELGYRVGTGLIVGLPGQTIRSIARDITLAKGLGVHMCSASPFVPAPNTPLEHAPYGSVETTLNALAIMRIVSPDWLIPSVSALEKSQQDGQLRGLRAGANVITINFSDDAYRNQYLIYGKDRFLVRRDYARALISEAGLVPWTSIFVGSGAAQPV